MCDIIRSTRSHGCSLWHVQCGPVLRYQTVIKLINKNLLGYSSISPDVDFVDCGDIFLKKV